MARRSGFAPLGCLHARISVFLCLSRSSCTPACSLSLLPTTPLPLHPPPLHEQPCSFVSPMLLPTHTSALFPPSYSPSTGISSVDTSLIQLVARLASRDGAHSRTSRRTNLTRVQTGVRDGSRNGRVKGRAKGRARKDRSYKATGACCPAST